jgi:hypothetical protein
MEKKKLIGPKVGKIPPPLGLLDTRASAERPLLAGLERSHCSGSRPENAAVFHVLCRATRKRVTPINLLSGRISRFLALVAQYSFLFQGTGW